ncbi:MAG TPA: nucleotidyltransferase domain-containing protein [Thermoanaerobaculia bacterium]|jgi:predicted nucleotidyltransferase|nr:nucleotidyltransferase domain-containing protein [Thermoanaerobaculia bacterium]
MDAAAIEERLREHFRIRAEASEGTEGIAAAWLFGSVARGTARPDSDVDVGVLFREDPPLTLAGYHFDLEADLQELLLLPVQLVVLNRAPVDLAFRVLRDGKLLVNQDPSRRIRFEVRTHNEYWDMEPYWRLYRKERGELDRHRSRL